MEHTPVLLNEVLEYLKPKPGERFIDATANGGGHLFAIAPHLAPNGLILGIEVDPEVFQKLQRKAETSDWKKNIALAEESYTAIRACAAKEKLLPVQGILFDLGMSSLQLEGSGRGFSFQKDEPLDMRFDPTHTTLRARDLVNHGTRDELEKIFSEYGEERYARRIANTIADERKHRPIKTTKDLVDIIADALPRQAKKGNIHFATRVFQGLRMAVNNEVHTIRTGITEALECLGKGGRIAVISFHSIEDRIVKELFRAKEKEGIVIQCFKKPLTASDEEIGKNRRSRSAKLRIAEKL